MPEHPFGSLDKEDRRTEKPGPWLKIIFALVLGVLWGLAFWGVL